MPNAEEIFHQLLQERPSLHGIDGLWQWQLADEVMHWLFETVKPGDRTLETGCGYSTLIFAMKGARHTVISPLSQEHDNIRAWGVAHGVDFSSVVFLAERSEEVLPTLVSKEALNLVLVDGWHAFPGPFIDWFFTCQKLAVGGRVVVDDTQIRSCRVLCDFLCAEKGRWTLESRFRRTDVFRKSKVEVFEGDWRSQPYGAIPIQSLHDRWKGTVRPRLVALTKRVPGLNTWLKRLRDTVARSRRAGGGRVGG